ncbi:methyltransferase [Prauserella marina]|uniref:Methyltransferase domain-containing protein n=1 Tax=Prauserella marina TaxID=530584 RepID=A0A222VRE7_9PSEU|nr:methyltransferase domain-containing protein [Prauserella marina]ASR36422.1 methyltransferase [Prauserella marina]PWV77230.1 methyltransferase family protein [Prauserella marina]SDD07371.1 Methyltransferase domain-containing protein [Prauserella marina]
MTNRRLPDGNNVPPTAHPTKLRIELPEPSDRFDQDSEFCLVEIDGTWQKIRFHDYDRIFAIPGLYEQLFHDILDCRSPDVVGKLLKEEIQRDNVDASSLRVLDLGAGNGLVAEQLRTVGAGYLFGVDIIPEARHAALRDRPEVYDEYLVADLTALSGQDTASLSQSRCNTLSCVAALGYSDIPPSAFRAAFNFISDGGWIAFTIKDRFLSDEDTSGFAKLIERCQEAGVLQVRSSERYRHRLNVGGEPLHYVALVGTKQADIPADLVH